MSETNRYTRIKKESVKGNVSKIDRNKESIKY